MADALPAADFDMQSAWFRRFKADAQSNMSAFALRLREAMPDEVTTIEKKPFFGAARICGVRIALGDHAYTLETDGRQLRATVAMTVRGITLSTKSLDPAEWFAQLASEMQKTAQHAQSLSRSLSAFMET